MRIWMAVLVTLGLAGSVRACESHGRRANVRACFANQKTIVGAIEMWNLDKNCRVEEHLAQGQHPLNYMTRGEKTMGQCPAHHAAPRASDEARVYTIPYDFLEQLKAEGYLMMIPTDPGQGKGTTRNYVLTSFGNGAMCLFHGDIQGGGMKTARQRMRELGVRDAAMLARASERDPRHVPWTDDPAAVCGLVVLIVAFLWTIARMMGTPDLTAAERFGQACCAGTVLFLSALPLAFVGLESLALVGTAWQVGAAGAAVLVGAVRALCGTPVLEDPVHEAYETPAPRARHPVPLLAPRGLKCAVCACTDGPAVWVTCPACDAAHHGECWNFQDGCAAFGCAMAHGRWRTVGALPRRTIAAGEAKGAISWIE